MRKGGSLRSSRNRIESRVWAAYGVPSDAQSSERQPPYRTPSRCSFRKRLHLIRLEYALLLLPGRYCCEPRIFVDAIGPGKVSGRHGTMKGDQSGRIAQISEQRRYIATAYEDLGVAAYQSHIEARQKIVAAVPSARANNSAHFPSPEHLVEFIQSSLHRSCKIQVAIQDRRQIKRLIAHAEQSRASRFQGIRLNRASRRDDPDGVAGPQCSRTHALRLDGRGHQDGLS